MCTQFESTNSKISDLDVQLHDLSLLQQNVNIQVLSRMKETMVPTIHTPHNFQNIYFIYILNH